MDIFDLVKNYDYETIKKNIKRYNVKKLDKFGQSALLPAFDRADFVIIAELLLQYGCDINNEDHFSNTILFDIPDFDNPIEKIKFCITHGVDINHLNKDKRNLLYYTLQDVEILKFLITEGLFINQLDKYNNNLLFHVSTYDYAKLLIDNDINIHQINHRGRNALFYINDSAIFELLIKNGINIQQIDNDGDSILTQKYCMLRPDTIELLVNNKINLLHTNNQGQTALHRYCHCPEIMDILTKNEDLLDLATALYSIEYRKRRSGKQLGKFKNIVPILNRSLLDYPFLQPYKKNFVTIDEVTTSNLYIIKYILSEIYPEYRHNRINLYDKCKTYFGVSTIEEVCLLLDEIM